MLEPSVLSIGVGAYMLERSALVVGFGGRLWGQLWWSALGSAGRLSFYYSPLVTRDTRGAMVSSM